MSRRTPSRTIDLYYYYYNMSDQEAMDADLESQLVGRYLERVSKAILAVYPA